MNLGYTCQYDDSSPAPSFKAVKDLFLGYKIQCAYNEPVPLPLSKKYNRVSSVVLLLLLLVLATCGLQIMRQVNVCTKFWITFTGCQYSLHSIQELTDICTKLRIDLQESLVSGGRTPINGDEYGARKKWLDAPETSARLLGHSASTPPGLQKKFTQKPGYKYLSLARYLVPPPPPPPPGESRSKLDKKEALGHYGSPRLCSCGPAATPPSFILHGYPTPEKLHSRGLHPLESLGKHYQWRVKYGQPSHNPPPFSNTKKKKKGYQAILLLAPSPPPLVPSKGEPTFLSLLVWPSGGGQSWGGFLHRNLFPASLYTQLLLYRVNKIQTSTCPTSHIPRLLAPTEGCCDSPPLDKRGDSGLFGQGWDCLPRFGLVKALLKSTARECFLLECRTNGATNNPPPPNLQEKETKLPCGNPA